MFCLSKPMLRGGGGSKQRTRLRLRCHSERTALWSLSACRNRVRTPSAACAGAEDAVNERPESS